MLTVVNAVVFHTHVRQQVIRFISDLENLLASHRVVCVQEADHLLLHFYVYRLGRTRHFYAEVLTF